VAGANVTISGTWPFQTINASVTGGGGGDALVSQPLSQFAATTSAQLRGVISDETGTGLLYFQGGDLGTPSSVTLSGGTGLPLATGISGFGAGIATALGVNIGTAGAPVVLGGAGGTPSAISLTNATGLPLATGTTGILPVASGGTGTATPGLVAGSNVTISGSWPSQTISASGGGGGGGSTVYSTSKLITPFLGTTTSGLANSANTIALISFDLKRSVRIDEMHARVLTGLAGAVFQMAIYGMDANGDPTGIPISTTASLSAAANANVFDALATPFNLVANTPYFWAVNVSTGTSVTFLALAATNTYPWTICGPSNMTGVSGTNMCFHYTIAQTFGTWPDLTGLTFATTMGLSRVPVGFFKPGAFV
jgi:hypothetical protein